MSLGEALAAGFNQYDESVKNPTWKQQRERRKLAQEKHVAEAGITATDNERKALESQRKLENAPADLKRADETQAYEDDATNRKRLAEMFIQDFPIGDFRRTVEQWNKTHPPEQNLENLTVDGQGNVVSNGTDGKTYTYPMEDVANYLSIELKEENGQFRLVPAGTQDKDLERAGLAADINKKRAESNQLLHLEDGTSGKYDKATGKFMPVDTGGVGLLGAQKGIADVGQTQADTALKKQQALTNQATRENIGISFETGNDDIIYRLDNDGSARPVTKEDGTPLQGKQELNDLKQKIKTLTGYGMSTESALTVATGSQDAAMKELTKMLPYFTGNLEGFNALVKEVTSLTNTEKRKFTRAAELEKAIQNGELVSGAIVNFNGEDVRIK